MNCVSTGLIVVFNRPGNLLDVEAACRGVDDVLVDAAFLVDAVGVAVLFNAALL